MLDNPDLIVACVIGDGEAETGPLAASWHSNKFLDPVGDGAVLPILHLNGYKISNPTVLSRLGDDELRSLLIGYGHRPIFVKGDEPAEVHQQLAAALDDAFDDIAQIQATTRSGRAKSRPTWPMIVLCTPKGWTCPKEVDGVPIEGTFRAHQVPVADVRANPAHLKILEKWLHSYRPDELFDESGGLRAPLRALAPTGIRRMSANPHANGGLLLQDLDLPDFRRYAVTVKSPGVDSVEPTRVLGNFLRDVIEANPSTFRVVGPDETISNRLSAVFEATDRVGRPRLCPETNFWRLRAESWRYSASMSVRGGWRVISSPVAMGSSIATRRLSTSSIRCSTSTRSGSRRRRRSPGDAPSPL